VENLLVAIVHYILSMFQEWVAKFEKPKGDPSSFEKPATTVLSPYLKVSDMLTICAYYYATPKEVSSDPFIVSHLLVQFGCLSVRHFYQCLQEIYRSVKHHTSPPVSLFGQVSCASM